MRSGVCTARRLLFGSFGAAFLPEPLGLMPLRRGEAVLQQKLVVVIILDKRLVIYVAYRYERLIFAVPDGLHITSLNSFLHNQNLKYRNGLYVLPTRQALDAATVTITNSVPAAALSHAGGVPKRRYISLRSAGIIGNDSSSAAIIR